MATKTGIQQAIGSVKRVWAELDYAQRRLFEIRTELPVTDNDRRVARSAEELNALYASDQDKLAA